MFRPKVELLDDSIDVDRLVSSMVALQDLVDGHHMPQISLTSATGEDEWTCCNGRLTDLKFPEKYYAKVNKSLVGTYIGDLIEKYDKYYRWRLLRLAPMTTYSVHRDSLNRKTNLRLHIPVITNNDALMTFQSNKPQDGATTIVNNYHLKAGNAYVTDTSSWHSAVNYGSEPRYHIVGVRYL